MRPSAIRKSLGNATPSDVHLGHRLTLAAATTSASDFAAAAVAGAEGDAGFAAGGGAA